VADTDIKTEMDAIAAIVAALEPLNQTARQRVLDYAIGHLGLQVSVAAQSTGPCASPEFPGTASHPPTAAPHRPSATDIRTLKEEKNPTNNVQMATIVAYYLAEVAPEEERKDSISTDDLKQYYTQAGYPLSPSPRRMLFKAKAAGYLDSAGHGKYKLTPVGHNLVVHRLPGSAAPARTAAPRKKAPAKKAPGKKAPGKKAPVKKAPAKRTPAGASGPSTASGGE